jgi:hypothetical protein
MTRDCDLNAHCALDERTPEMYDIVKEFAGRIAGCDEPELH